MSRLNQTLVLSDGRTLGYAEAGCIDGKSVFIFHGLHSSRLEVALIDEKMKENRVRIIAIDRVGIGLSTFKEHHTLFDTIDDMIALAEYLGIKKFSVIGTSSGAKCALACAYTIPERLRAVFCLSSGVPIEYVTDDVTRANRVALNFIQKAPWLIKPLFWLSYARISQQREKIDTFLGNIVLPLDKVDKDLLFNNTKIKAQFALQCKESYVQGAKGNAQDARFDMLENSWGFELDDIDFSPIYVWHGTLDKGIPLSMAKVLDEKVKNIAFDLLEGEGHLTLIFKVIDNVVEKLEH